MTDQYLNVQLKNDMRNKKWCIILDSAFSLKLVSIHYRNGIRYLVEWMNLSEFSIRLAELRLLN